MKNQASFAKIALLLMTIVVSLLAVRMASSIYYYEVVVNGVLGFFVIYLMIRVFWSSKTEDFYDKRLGFSDIIKYFVFTFVYSIVIYWALIQFFEMVLFLIGLFI